MMRMNSNTVSLVRFKSLTEINEYVDVDINQAIQMAKQVSDKISEPKSDKESTPPGPACNMD